MKFSIDIGKNEKHSISYSFNKFWGNVSIKVNDKKIISDFRMFSTSLTNSYEFEIGIAEKHKIKIEKIRPLAFAGFRTNRYLVFLDGKFLKEFLD